jgi:hypothetical protein
MRRLSLVLLLPFASVGCASGIIGDEEGESDVQLAAELRLLENHPNCEDVEVKADGLTYLWKTDASAVDVGVGSVLIGEKGGGYVRRVTSVFADGNTLELATEPASLADALVEGDLTMPLVPADAQWVQCPEGAACAAIDFIDLSNTVLFDGDVGGVPLSVKIPQGGLRFTPAVDFSMSVGFPGKIKRLSGTVTGTFTADLTVEAQAGGSVDFSREIDVSGPGASLYSYPFTFVAPTPLGPLPIVGTANMDVFVGFRASATAVATVSTGVSASAAVAVGATYENGNWTATATPSVDASFQPIQLEGEASTSVEAYARPEVSVTFYGVAGPRISIEPLLRLNSELISPTAIHSELEACLRGELGFSVKILSFSLADFSRSLERCLTLFDGVLQ